MMKSSLPERGSANKPLVVLEDDLKSLKSANKSPGLGKLVSIRLLPPATSVELVALELCCCKYRGEKYLQCKHKARV